MIFPTCISDYDRFCASMIYFSLIVYVYSVNVNLNIIFTFVSIYLASLIRIYVLFSLISIRSHSIIDL